MAAARAVGRVNIRNQAGRVVGYGTASLVSTHLILTNHHVLPTAEVARWSAIEFNYQDGVDGQPLQPRMFRLDPDRFYLADKEHDFAFVAVAASEGELAEFGFNRLVDVEGNAVVGEFVTIVQHPKGEKKQVSLRENRVVDLLDSFIHYETDTEPGSSGSPVFNDQWEVVALHHASVPAPDHAELGHIMNEGIRITAVLRAATAPQPGLPASMRQPPRRPVRRRAVGRRDRCPDASAPGPVAAPASWRVADGRSPSPRCDHTVHGPRPETTLVSARRHPVHRAGGDPPSRLCPTGSWAGPGTSTLYHGRPPRRRDGARDRRGGAPMAVPSPADVGGLDRAAVDERGRRPPPRRPPVVTQRRRPARPSRSRSSCVSVLRWLPPPPSLPEGERAQGTNHDRVGARCPA